MSVNTIVKKRISALLLCLWIALGSFAQDEFMIHGHIKAYDTPIEGATVRVLYDFVTIKRVVLDNSGAYTLYLPYGKKYTIVFEKTGFTKMQIDANMILPSDAKQCCYRPLELSFNLFRPDASHGDLFNSTFYTIQYDARIKGFVYDVDVDYMVQQRIVNAELFKKRVLISSVGAQAMRDSMQIEKQYLALINKGTEYYNEKQFYASRKFFLEAAKLKPDRMYPKYKLDDIKTELQRFETKVELLGINLDTLIARELAALIPIQSETEAYPAFIPLTDEQVEEIFKNDIKRQIIQSSANVAEANRTLALMNEFFKDDYKRITAREFQAKDPVREFVPVVKPVEKQTIVQKPEPVVTKQVEESKPIDIASVPVKKVEKPAPVVSTPKKVVDFSTYQDSLKQKYPMERTIEVSQDAHKKTTRVFLNNGKVVEIYAMVEHAFGATYYFIEEYPSGAQSIGYAAFMNRTKLYDQMTPSGEVKKDSVHTK